MPAMHDVVEENMLKVLEEKRNLMLRTLSFEMTHEECLDLVADKNHHELLLTAAKIAKVSASEDWFALRVPDTTDAGARAEVFLMMRTHGGKQPPLVPRYPYWQPGASGGEKVIAWLRKRMEIGRRFGIARYALRNLNVLCDNGHQLRYMFPAVLHLCKAGMDDKLDRWMTKHAAFKTCPHTPALSPELRKGVQDASALLTTVALMDPDMPAPLVGEVDITESGVMPPFKCDGDLVARM